ncbi:MAG: hypothetical protein Q4D38_00580 [Planctomycetia bacterium]|nr:hypothetical protein [Planctomycetia bacterium]
MNESKIFSPNAGSNNIDQYLARLRDVKLPSIPSAAPNEEKAPFAGSLADEGKKGVEMPQSASNLELHASVLSSPEEESNFSREFLLYRSRIQRELRTVRPRTHTETPDPAGAREEPASFSSLNAFSNSHLGRTQWTSPSASETISVSPMFAPEIPQTPPVHSVVGVVGTELGEVIQPESRGARERVVPERSPQEERVRMEILESRNELFSVPPEKKRDEELNSKRVVEISADEFVERSLDEPLEGGYEEPFEEPAERRAHGANNAFSQLLSPSEAAQREDRHKNKSRGTKRARRDNLLLFGLFGIVCGTLFSAVSQVLLASSHELLLLGVSFFGSGGSLLFLREIAKRVFSTRAAH